jgi:hypothetical protein
MDKNTNLHKSRENEHISETICPVNEVLLKICLFVASNSRWPSVTVYFNTGLPVFMQRHLQHSRYVCFYDPYIATAAAVYRQPARRNWVRYSGKSIRNFQCTLNELDQHIGKKGTKHLNQRHNQEQHKWV